MDILLRLFAPATARTAVGLLMAIACSLYDRVSP